MSGSLKGEAASRIWIRSLKLDFSIPHQSPFVSSKVREEWHHGIKAFQSVLSPTSSVLCYVVLFVSSSFSSFSFPNNYVIGSISYIPFGCLSQSMQQLKGVTCSAEEAGGKMQVVCLCCEYWFENWCDRKEIFCLSSDILRQVIESTSHLYSAFLPSPP